MLLYYYTYTLLNMLVRACIRIQAVTVAMNGMNLILGRSHHPGLWQILRLRKGIRKKGQWVQDWDRKENEVVAIWSSNKTLRPLPSILISPHQVTLVAACVFSVGDRHCRHIFTEFSMRSWYLVRTEYSLKWTKKKQTWLAAIKHNTLFPLCSTWFKKI